MEIFDQTADAGTLFLHLDVLDRTHIATTIERLINLLDDMEPDPDLEPYLAGYHKVDDDREGDGGAFGMDEDFEPSLGWAVNGQHGQNANLASSWGDLELDTSDDEPWLGWPNGVHVGAGTGDDREQECEDEGAQVDEEYTLGWSEHQSLVGSLSGGSFGTSGEGEPDLGFVGIATGWREGEDIEDREADNLGDDEREREDDYEPWLGWSEHQAQAGACPTGDEFTRAGNGPALFDGPGYAIARNALRKRLGKPALAMSEDDRHE